MALDHAAFWASRRRWRYREHAGTINEAGLSRWNISCVVQRHRGRYFAELTGTQFLRQLQSHRVMPLDVGANSGSTPVHSGGLRGPHRLGT